MICFASFVAAPNFNHNILCLNSSFINKFPNLFFPIAVSEITHRKFIFSVFDDSTGKLEPITKSIFSIKLLKNIENLDLIKINKGV